ncbi:acyl-CoA N-acyltransferase [Mycena floridula]|nr:acyl-CoA N-acyltransferase [Mycena floridula]
MTITTPATNSRVSFASVTPNNLGTVRKLNSVLFPVKYSEKFYNDILSREVEDFCQLVYYNDIPGKPAPTTTIVGTFCCRIENRNNEIHLYLMTMGILAPYRSRRLGSQCLERLLSSAAAHVKPSISKIYLHVQTSNSDAKRFYEAHGFQEVGIHENYYKKILPADAWILEKEVSSS